MTTRFNNSTWQENKKFREAHPKIGCIYCAPDPITKEIPTDSILFVLEMNNDMNRIMGVGMVKKNYKNNGYKVIHHVYQNTNYCRYSLTGQIRIDRADMRPEEELIMKVFDALCFKGNKHMKRGQGLKQFPVDMLYRMSPLCDLVKFVTNMFKSRLTQ